ncbi:hypothetical protein BsWGS_18672 [Bradybaena similaris]
MAKTGLLIFLVLIYLSSIHAIGDYCPYKVCSCFPPQIYCMRLNLTYLPPVASVGILRYGYLVLDQNNITAVPAGRLPSNLTNISFTDNPIATIALTAFDGSQNTLQTLSFSNARFTQIPLAFGRLHSLKQLSIYDTKILVWDTDCLKNIGHTIQTLYLNNVGLTAWPGWLQYFLSLKELSIVQASISSVPDNCLDHVNRSLTSLTIMNTNITSIPKTIASLQSLTSLDLLDNKISDVTWIPQDSKLSSLSLNNNFITDANVVSKVLRPLAKTLSDIELVGNRMTSFPDLSFLTHCEGFDLSNNRISNYTSGSLPPLTYELNLGGNYLPAIPQFLSRALSLSDLVLSSNVIKYVRGQDLPPLVMELDLGYNLIIEIADDSFMPNSRIVSLSLNNNPIIRISDVVFSNFPYLSELNLQSTKLTRLPLGLSSLTSLDSFDASDSKGLVCTCMEKDLTAFFLKLQFVTGNCGATSIYEFFTALSPSCPS